MKQLAMLFVLGAGSVIANATLLIDDFTDGAYDSGYVQGRVVNTTAASVLGGTRSTIVDVLNNPLDEDAKIKVQTTVEDGIFTHATGPGLLSVAALGYGVQKNGLYFDYLDNNWNLAATPKIQIEFIANDLPLLVRTFLCKSDGVGGLASYDLESQTVNPVGSSTWVTFDFTGATLLGQVDSIEFDFYNEAGGDFAIGGIQAVPEPASIALLAIGIASLARRRR